SYVLEGGLHGHGMDELSELHLSHTPIAFGEVTGKGKDKITFDCVPVAEATKYSAEDADVTLRLHMLLKPKLGEMGKRAVYETLERPLALVLADMERASISTSALPSSWAISCSARWGWKAGARPRPAPGPPTAICWRMLRPRAMRSPRRCWTGAAWPSCAAPIPMPCPATSIPRRAACTHPMRWPRPQPPVSHPEIPICRTSRSAPRKAAAFVRPLSPPRAPS